MGRKCSHCETMGHNSRTCSTYTALASAASPSPSPAAAAAAAANAIITNVCGLRLFGVHLDLSTSSLASSSSPSPSSSSSSSSSPTLIANNMRKCFSLDSLSPSLHASHSDDNINKIASSGYVSDGLTVDPQDKRKGVSWTEEEHRRFLIGLERLGKGDWRGISKNYVKTRTPTQVASHAQKYFLRQACLDKKKRRSSLFDMVTRNNATWNLKLDYSPPANQQSVSYTAPLFGSIDLSQKLQNSDIKPEPSSVAGPDLELSLAAPTRPSEVRKPPAEATGCFLINPISVT